MKESISYKKHFNYVTSLFETPQIEVNPYFMMKFDCRSINDVLCITFTQDNKDTMLLVAACNDCYIRVFDTKELNLLTTLRGIFGAALCLDASSDKSLMVAGYEDDSFIIYGVKMGFAPICRG